MSHLNWWCLFWCSRLVVWCLWSVQFEWDVLPTRPKLKPLQWNQMVLLERLGLLTEVHYNDDQTSRLLGFPLNRHSQIKQSGKEILPDKQQQTTKPKIKFLKGAKALHENIFTYLWKDIFWACLCVCVIIWIKWVVAKEIVKYGLSKWQISILKILLTVVCIHNYRYSNYSE